MLGTKINLRFRAFSAIHLASTLTMSKKQPKHLVDPTQLKPIDSEDGTLQVIIETPKGSRNKYAYDTEQGIFSLTKVLPAGMVLPETLAPDGDAIDVLLLMDEPAFPGCWVDPA